jgi:hypothetical protein
METIGDVSSDVHVTPDRLPPTPAVERTFVTQASPSLEGRPAAAMPHTQHEAGPVQRKAESAAIAQPSPRREPTAGESAPIAGRGGTDVASTKLEHVNDTPAKTVPTGPLKTITPTPTAESRQSGPAIVQRKASSTRATAIATPGVPVAPPYAEPGQSTPRQASQVQLASPQSDALVRTESSQNGPAPWLSPSVHEARTSRTELAPHFDVTDARRPAPWTPGFPTALTHLRLPAFNGRAEHGREAAASPYPTFPGMPAPARPTLPTLSARSSQIQRFVPTSPGSSPSAEGVIAPAVTGPDDRVLASQMAPGMDITNLADQVYEILSRRLSGERERRGA